ncbi:DUF4304 domain-containing protein [Amycolatopsis sp. OK19-0408]|uniref:DUF4304 domain-containing protein n=1 Tax=Amycolatopsis iheyensis TaxID=2945988 RepID=A0A9X2NC31_9PSEU|nr:DUF4304 domain-containing protein [Amycolatopsis iheyensis]MCR6484277.1 DUF4304 domain-containing protein [Amycolatopsis iheyensis]
MIGEFRAMLRDRIGPALRAEGFTGTAPTWRLTAPTGDCAIVNVQSSSMTSATAVRFVVNMAVVPEPWWNRPGRPGSGVRPGEADGLWRDRLHPTPGVPQHGPEPWWLVRREADLEQCGDDVLRQLASRGVPRLRELLDRERLVATIRTGDFGFTKSPDPAYALAILGAR